MAPKNIKATVENGFVSLSGEIDWNSQREEAEKKIRCLPGVKGITNLITLKPAPIADNVKECIKNELKRNAEINANNIEIEVNGSEIILKRKVHSWSEVKQAKRAAWLCSGVTSVK